MGSEASVTTAAQLLYSTNNRRQSFLLSADKANGDQIWVSSVDRSAKNQIVEMGAGEWISFTDFVGDVFGQAASGTLYYSVSLLQDIPDEMPRYTSFIKGP